MIDKLGEPLTEEETRQLIDEIAGEVIKRRLETPAVLFLEMHKPLSFIAGQAFIVAMPFLSVVFPPQKMAMYGRLWQDRGNVERLIRRIEEVSEERDLAKKAKKEGR